MNRELYYRYFGVQLEDISSYYSSVHNEVESRISLDPSVDSIVELIYSPDEFTRLPNGDISLYLSSSTRPEIKQFIIDNLQQDLRGREIDSVPSKYVSDGSISDDDIIYLTRSSSESRESYLSRVYSYISDNSKKSSSDES